MKRFIIAFITVCSLWSCDKYLEVEPTNVLAIQTYDDVKALMGAGLRIYDNYESLNNVYIHYGDMSNYLQFQFYSDDLNSDTYLDNWKARNNRGIFYQSLNWKQEQLPGRLWRMSYSSIGYYNTVLDELNKLSGYTEDEANIIKGEAKYLRAWNLFKLMQYFSPYKNDKLGIPVNLVPEEVGSYDSRRKTQTEVYEIIIDDLNEILAYKTESTSFNRFYDKKLINALLAKVYHYKAGSGAGVEGDWDNAILYAKAAIEGRSITTIADFDDLLAVEEEGFFKDKSYALIVNSSYTGNTNIGDIVGVPSWMLKQYPTEDLYNLFSDDDIRKSKFFAPDRSILKLTVNVPYSNTPHYLFRVADFNLIIAESYARKGDAPNAKTALEEFQANRINNYSGFTGSDLLQEILNERRREFCFEYDMRWTDMHRLGDGFSRAALDDDEVETYTLEDDDYRLTLPIPRLEELDYNKIDQNPGWSLF